MVFYLYKLYFKDIDRNGLEYIKNIISKVDIIKPSEVDAERIFGCDTPENQVKKFIDLGQN